MKSLSALAKTLRSRVFAFITMEDRSFFDLLSPAIQSLRYADGFVRNVFVLMTGTTLAMIVPVAAAPLLTRLFTPQDYGIFALYVSVVSVVSVPITGNYDSAIVLPKKDGDALNLAAVCLIIAFIFSGLLLLASLLYTREWTALLGNGHIAAYLPLVPAMAFLMGLHGTVMYWANRKRQFRRLAANKVVESVVAPLGSLILGFYSWGASGLITALIAGKAAAAIMLGPRIWREKRDAGITLKRKSMIGQARKYGDFPLYSAPASLLETVALQVPVLLMTKSFSLTVVGLFALTTRVIGAPLALVTQCIAQVYYQWVAEAKHKKNSGSYVLNVAGYLALLIAGPTLIVMLFSPALFSFIFGSQWRVAGEYARILMFPMAIKFVVSPLTTIMPATGNIRLGSVWKTVYVASTVVVLYIASHFSVKTFLCVYAAHDSLLYVCYFFLVMKASASLRAVEEGAVGAADTG